MTKLPSTLLALALAGTFGAAFAADTVTTTMTNTLSNKYTNDITNIESHKLEENIKVDWVFGAGDSMATASVNDVQKNINNRFSVPMRAVDPDVSTITGSVNSTAGNVGVNNASGFFNQQANNVAIASSKGATDSAARAAANFEQLGKDNTYTLGNMPLIAKSQLSGSVNSTAGNVGVNNAAGSGNQQKNDLAIAVADGAMLASANTGGMQMITNTSVTASGQINLLADINQSINNTAGNVGVNNTSGLSNQQVNTLAIAASAQ